MIHTWAPSIQLVVMLPVRAVWRIGWLVAFRTAAVCGNYESHAFLKDAPDTYLKPWYDFLHMHESWQMP